MEVSPRSRSQTQGSRWWSDQLDLFIPSLGYLMQKMDGPESRRRTALQVVARVLDILVRNAHLPTGEGSSAWGAPMRQGPAVKLG